MQKMLLPFADCQNIKEILASLESECTSRQLPIRDKTKWIQDLTLELQRLWKRQADHALPSILPPVVPAGVPSEWPLHRLGSFPAQNRGKGKELLETVDKQVHDDADTSTYSP